MIGFVSATEIRVRREQAHAAFVSFIGAPRGGAEGCAASFARAIASVAAALAATRDVVGWATFAVEWVWTHGERVVMGFLDRGFETPRSQGWPRSRCFSCSA